MHSQNDNVNTKSAITIWHFALTSRYCQDKSATTLAQCLDILIVILPLHNGSHNQTEILLTPQPTKTLLSKLTMHSETNMLWFYNNHSMTVTLRMLLMIKQPLLTTELHSTKTEWDWSLVLQLNQMPRRGTCQSGGQTSQCLSCSYNRTSVHSTTVN